MSVPIVLAHGIARFDALLAGLGVHLYFKEIPEHLAVHGFKAYRSSVDYAGSVKKRSEDLEKEVERIRGETGADKVHIIAHSMGGLDARHMIVDLGMADRVASLTTIGTPHRGTSFADVALADGGSGFIDVVGGLGMKIEGFRDLTTAACAEFNKRAEPAEAGNPVRYMVYSSFQEKSKVFLPLRHSWQIIHDKEGKNDGLVPVSSQEWTSKLTNEAGVEKAVIQRQFPFGADHLNETGLWDVSEGTIDSFESWDSGSYERRVRDIYLDIAKEVTAQEGF